MRLFRVFSLLAFCALAVVAAASAAAPRVDMPYAMTVRVIDDQKGKYEVEVDNTNPVRFISSFNWSPPAGMNVTSVDRSIGGHCTLAGGTITCTGLAAPPASDGGVGEPLIVDFTATGRQPTWANGYWIHYGVVGAVAVQTSKFSDLPPCKTGQKSTKTHPCGGI